ncbi:MAG: flagellar motor protein MotB [Halochromatium sp.]|nr:flagellar motor protein MotB [Halochromatium sp.]
MLEHGDRLSMPETKTGGDSDAWLMSYLDVLTLLITLFVLLVSMLGKSSSESAQDLGDASTRADQQIAVANAGTSASTGTSASGSGNGTLSSRAQSAAQQGGSSGSTATGSERDHDGLRPQHAGILPRDPSQQKINQQAFRGLEGVDGVSIAEGQEGITLRIDDNLLFASGEAKLTATGRNVIESLVPTLTSFDGQISVEGHTDNIPISTARFPSNWELSTSRAIAVLRHLIQSGIPEARLRAIGYADTQPLDSNDSAAGRAVNRRVELLLKQRL